MKHIFIIMIGLTCLTYSDFSKNNGIVTDSKTTLQWQDEYSDNWEQIKEGTWTEALNYCEALELGGYTDWRLPNIVELLSIVDYSIRAPSIDLIFEYMTDYDTYWTSTSTTNELHAYTVDFYQGFPEYSKKFYEYGSYEHAIRCVRDGQ